jgi:TfoX/Sxy family transcriptional regulator of competence genes
MPIERAAVKAWGLCYTADMDLEDRLSNALGAFETERKRMFGGLCFMLNGNMLMGTFRGGLMARVSKASHKDAIKLPGARAMEMKGRVMEGFMLIDADSVEDDASLQRWVDMALAYNSTLPAKASKPPKATAQKR